MENKSTRLSKAARLFNVGISTIVEFLAKKGIQIDSGPNTKISPEAYDLLAEEYSSDLTIKQKSEELSRKNLEESHESLSIGDVSNQKEANKEEEVIIKDVSSTEIQKEVKPEEPFIEQKPEIKKEEEEKELKAPSTEKKKKSVDVKVVGKIDLDKVKKKAKPSKKPVTEKPEKQEEKNLRKPNQLQKKLCKKNLRQQLLRKRKKILLKPRLKNSLVLL